MLPGQSASLLSASLSESLFDRTAGTNIGDATSNGGLPAAFDGVTAQASASCAARVTVTNMYIGKTHASPQIISRAIVYASNNNGYVAAANPNITATIYGKNGTSPANGTDGTAIGTLGPFADTADESAGREITCTDQSTSWDHNWVYFSKDGAVATMNCAEIQFYVLS